MKINNDNAVPEESPFLFKLRVQGSTRAMRENEKLLFQENFWFEPYINK